MNTVDMQEFAKLSLEKRELTANLKVVQGKLTKFETAIIDDLANEGISSVKIEVEGEVVTLYTRFEVYPKFVAANELEGVTNEDKGRAYDALAVAGYGDMVTRTVHHKRLASILKELADESGELPMEFDGCLTVSRVPRLSLRKG